MSEDGGAFKLPCFDRTSEDWMLEVKIFSTIYLQGDEGNLYLQLVSPATFQCNYFADDCDLLHLPEARGGEPIMADAWR